MAADIDELAETVVVHIGWLRHQGGVDSMQSADYLERLVAALRALADAMWDARDENETARAVIRRLLDELTHDDAVCLNAQWSDAERALLASIENAPREPAGDGQPMEDR